VTYAAILLGGAVAWVSSRRSKTGILQDATVARRSPFAVNAVDVTIVLIYAVLPFLIAVVAVSLRNVGPAPDGWLWPGYLVPAVAVLATCAATSHVLGYLTSSTLLAVLSGAGASLIIAFYTAMPIAAPPELRPAWEHVGALCAAAAFSLAVALVVPVFVVGRRPEPASGRTRALALGATALAVLVALVAASSSGPSQVTRPAPTHLACAGVEGESRVCTWPDHAAYLDELVPLARRANQVAAGVFPPESTFYEFGLEDNTGAKSFKVLAQGHGLWFTAGGMADTFINRVTLRHFCTAASESDDAKRTRDITNLEYWLQSRIYGGNQPGDVVDVGGSPDTSEARAALRRSGEEQRVWGEATLSGINSTPCADTP